VSSYGYGRQPQGNLQSARLLATCGGKGVQLLELSRTTSHDLIWLPDSNSFGVFPSSWTTSCPLVTDRWFWCQIPSRPQKLNHVETHFNLIFNWLNGPINLGGDNSAAGGAGLTATAPQPLLRTSSAPPVQHPCARPRDLGEFMEEGG